MIFIPHSFAILTEMIMNTLTPVSHQMMTNISTHIWDLIHRVQVQVDVVQAIIIQGTPGEALEVAQVEEAGIETANNFMSRLIYTHQKELQKEEEKIWDLGILIHNLLE